MTPKLTGLKQYMRVISGCLRVGNPRIAQLSAAQGLAGLEESPDGSRGRTCFRTQVTWLLEGWRLLAGCWASGLGSVLSVGRRPPDTLPGKPLPCGDVLRQSHPGAQPFTKRRPEISCNLVPGTVLLQGRCIALVKDGRVLMTDLTPFAAC